MHFIGFAVMIYRKQGIINEKRSKLGYNVVQWLMMVLISTTARNTCGEKCDKCGFLIYGGIILTHSSCEGDSSHNKKIIIVDKFTLKR